MQRLRIQLPGGQQAAGEDGLQHWDTPDRRLPGQIERTDLHQLPGGG
jgi:hypothetical protein